MTVIPWSYEIQVDWYCDHGSCPALSLYRDGQLLWPDVKPYDTDWYYDWLSHQDVCRGWYRYFDWVLAGEYCYAAANAWNQACVSVP
ncbi:MAG: hypothetical protein H5U38_12165 [Calditrichaeota bacterium]|nr:hypothetical protein [Calditrichota bacterium]